jgi:CHAT domain-containing protein
MAADELLRRIDELLSRMKDMEHVPEGERGEASASRRDLAQRIASARNEYETLRLRIAREHPGASGLLSARVVPAAEIIASLHPGELLVQYMLTPERLLIFAATSSGVRAVTEEITAADLTQQARLARDLFSQKDSDSAATTPVSRSLYESLIEPLRTSGLLDSARRLVIVPHGALAYLPFAALRDPATGRTLSDDRALVMLPSAGALPMLRSQTMEARRTTARQPGGVVLAPFPRRLPATEREARAVLRAVPNSVAQLGERATEHALREALEYDRPVHVATHGVMNARNPMFSRIELARGPRASETDDDGRLEVHELLVIAIQSPLVFLSGCETGVGSAWSTEFAKGEDYATLAQAFLYSGARNVIATLWRIDDEGAAVFAEAFYRHLIVKPPAEALASTQRDMRRHPRFWHPYYWAGYTLSGGASAGTSRSQ